jgi:hypothetical protein
MSHFIIQEHNEKRFNRKHIDGYIREAIQSDPVMQEKIAEGILLVDQYIFAARNDRYYKSKNVRVMQLYNMDIEALVTDIFVGVAYSQRPELFTSVTAQMAARLRFSDKTEAIITTAELMAVLCNTDAFDILKPAKMASLHIVSRIPLSEKLVTFIDESQFLPPMVVPPLELTSNFCSGYLTHNDSLILGSGNHHDGDLCLDVLNTMNAVELSLDTEFLCSVEEEPNEPITMENVIKAAAKRGVRMTEGQAKIEIVTQLNNWKQFKIHSYRFYDLMASQGNVFHMTHKVDKRGRAYSQGYHINPQGSAFKKASIELANPEYIEGVPC